MADLSQIPTEQLLAMARQQQQNPLASIPTEQLISMAKNHPDAQQGAPKVSDDMGTMDRLLAMYGRGVAELGQGTKQLGLHAAGALGLADPESVKDYDKQVSEEAKLYEKDLGQRTGGSFLPWFAKVATTAPIAALKPIQAAGAVADLGNAALQGGAMNAAQPVTGGDFGAQKALEVGLGAAGGAGAGAVAKALGLGAEAAMNPTASLLNPVLKRGNATPFAKESERLAQETGVALTPAQVSGSPSANMAENMARQSIFSKSLASEGDKARTQQLQDYFNKVMTGVSASDASPDIAGKQVQAAASNLIRGLEKARSDAASVDFGKVRAMTKDAATIQPENTNALLQQIMEENSGIGTPTGDALAAFAKKQLSNVAPAAQKEAEKTAPSQGNLDKLMQLRSYLSKVAGGQAKISGENQDRRIATQLLQTIDADIDQAGQQIGGDLGGALKSANDRYRAFSQQIDSVHQSPLGGILGEDLAGAFQSGNFNTVAPEKVIEKLSSLKPSELGVVRGLMEKSQPDAWNVFKRSYLESALEKSQQMPASMGANTPVLRPSVLVKTLGDAKKLEAVFSPQEVSQINNLVGVARRLADTTGYNFSGTAPAQEALGMLNSLATGGVKAAAKIGSTALGSRQLARLMTDANGRAALIELQRLPPGSARARELVSHVSALLSGEQADEP